MKKPLSFLLSAAFLALSVSSLSGCEIVNLNDEVEEITTPAPETAVDISILPPEPEYPYIADIKSERLLDTDASQLADLEYDGATIEYVYSTEFTEYIIDEMRGQAYDTFLKYLKLLNASDRKDESFKQIAGVGHHTMRITLSTGEKIYLGIETGLGGDVFVNNTPYECEDHENRNKLSNFIKKGYTPPDFLIPNADRTKEVNGAELTALNFDGAEVEYLNGAWGRVVSGKMPAEDAARFFECLNAAEISSEIYSDFYEKNEDDVFMVGSPAYVGFRITLNTKEKIFIYIDKEYNATDAILINDHPYKCDEATFEMLERLLTDFDYNEKNGGVNKGFGGGIIISDPQSTNS